MRVLVTKCSAIYDGRLSSTLSSGVRLVMVKADGCVAIHADIGAYKPINWMNAPNTLAITAPGEASPVIADPTARMKPATDGEVWTVTNPKGETLTITLEEVLEDVSYDLDIERGLVLDGVEKELQALLAAHPTHIEDGLELVKREFYTDLGPVDLLCKGPDGESVAVEIKRIGEIASVDQLTRYLERMERDPLLTPVRGVLAATEIKPQAKVLAASRGIAVAEVDLRRLRGEADPELRLFDV